MKPTSVRLPVWKGYRAGDRYEDASDGVLEITYHGDRPTTGQKRAIEVLKESGAEMQARLLDAIVAAYPTFREWEPRPAKVTRASLRKLVAPYEVYVLKESHEGLAYVGYGFSCAWDPSGIVVLTHGDRIVAAGGSEVLGYPVKDPTRAPAKIRRASPAQRAAARLRARTAAKKNPKRLVSREETTVVLPVWAGFTSRPDDKPSKGEVSVGFGESADEGPVGDAQQAAYRTLVDDAKRIQGLLLDAIVAEYPKMLQKLDGFFIDMPKKMDRRALEDFVELQGVVIHDTVRAGVAYVGYSFSCDWEREHGLGILLHGDRVVEIGGAETSFLSWIAERDRDRTKRTPRKTRA